MTERSMKRASLAELRQMKEKRELFHDPNAPEGEKLGAEFWARAEVTGPRKSRSVHLKLAWEAQARGELVLAGAYADPADGAALLFSCDSDKVPQAFAEADPYVRNGLVVRWRVRAWTTVVGAAANTPVRT